MVNGQMRRCAPFSCQSLINCHRSSVLDLPRFALCRITPDRVRSALRPRSERLGFCGVRVMDVGGARCASVQILSPLTLARVAPIVEELQKNRRHSSRRWKLHSAPCLLLHCAWIMIVFACGIEILRPVEGRVGHVEWALQWAPLWVSGVIRSNLGSCGCGSEVLSVVHLLIHPPLHHRTRHFFYVLTSLFEWRRCCDTCLMSRNYRVCLPPMLAQMLSMVHFFISLLLRLLMYLFEWY